MDAVAALAQVRGVQLAFEMVAALMLTAYLLPQQAVVFDQEQFEFIVVGAGSAGAVLAGRLALGGHRVLLVDAGGDPPLESLTPGLLGFLPQSRYDWNYTTENDNYSFQCHRSRTADLTVGRVLGGGSSINYMLYVRGCPGDFTSWAAAAKDSTWDWHGVLPYFIRSERLQDREIINSPLNIYHGTEGFLGVTSQKTTFFNKYLESFRELGHDIIPDINSNCNLGYNQPMFTISEGVRQSTAYTVLAALKNKRNLHVLKNALVTQILFDEQNNAVGISASTDDGKEITLRASKEIIVSAGAFNTPRLLMLSGIGPKEHLQSLNIPVRSDLPVGENLQDHPAVLLSIKLEKSNVTPPVADPRRFPFDIVTGYVALNTSDTCPDYQSINFIVPNDDRSVLSLCVFNFGLSFDICQRIYNAGIGTRTLFSTVVLLHPKSRGRVLLRSRNPTDPPLIYGRYISNDRDLETIVDSLIDFVKVLNATYFKSINAEMVDLGVCTELQYWSRAWWRCYARCIMMSLYHYSGTCALGAVVDSRLRVLGVRRLRVADASIMPTVVGANTNAATIMIGEKAADFIGQDHSRHFKPDFSFIPPYFIPFLYDKR